MTVSPSQRSYTSLFQLAHHFLRDNFLINEIGDAQFYQTQICKFGGMKFDTHTVLSRDKVLISLFILLQVLLCSGKYMKLPKCGILVNKTTYLFTSIREQYLQEVCENFGNSGGEGVRWGGPYGKSLPWWSYGYFLEPHNEWHNVFLPSHPDNL